MPSYTYLCADCRVQSQLMHGLSSKTVPVCPKCGSECLKRVLRGSGFHIAGPGVYREGFSQYRAPLTTPDGELFKGDKK